MSELNKPRILPGKVTISRVTSNRDDFKRCICIRVYDESSSREIVEVSMTPEEFAMALTGMSHTACQCEWSYVELIGKVREHKTEVVEVPTGYGRDEKRKKAVRKAIAAYEVDGWTGYDEDAFNSHKRAGGTNAYHVGFVRFVDAPEMTEEKGAKESNDD